MPMNGGNPCQLSTCGCGADAIVLFDWPCVRTADFLTSIGFDIAEELWSIDGTDCSPCDNKVPDSR